ncbi:hypothetical protein M422DRAFT_31176, partial [Sphaerobolus stellatus SS14]
EYKRNECLDYQITVKRWGYGRYEDAEERMGISPARKTIALSGVPTAGVDGRSDVISPLLLRRLDRPTYPTTATQSKFTIPMLTTPT